VTAALTELAYRLNGALFGPGSQVPWWAWVALLGMIFWGLLVRGAKDG
jgi:hypothetical protein